MAALVRERPMTIGSIFPRRASYSVITLCGEPNTKDGQDAGSSADQSAAATVSSAIWRRMFLNRGCGRIQSNCPVRWNAQQVNISP